MSPLGAESSKQLTCRIPTTRPPSARLTSAACDPEPLINLGSANGDMYRFRSCHFGTVQYGDCDYQTSTVRIDFRYTPQCASRCRRDRPDQIAALHLDRGDRGSAGCSRRIASWRSCAIVAPIEPVTTRQRHDRVAGLYVAGEPRIPGSAPAIRVLYPNSIREINS